MSITSSKPITRASPAPPRPSAPSIHASRRSSTSNSNKSRAHAACCKLSCMRTILLSLILAASLAAAHKPAQKKVVQPKDFPTGRPFSPGILVDGTLYVAGQTGSDVKTGKIPDEFEAEVKQALDNVGAILKEAGMGYENAVAVQVY